MKKYLLILHFTILFILLIFCQETKLVVKKIGRLKNISKTYYVLKSDKRVKHEEYIKYFKLTKDEYKKISKGKFSPDGYI